jgi:hypothetical protein
MRPNSAFCASGLISYRQAHGRVAVKVLSAVVVALCLLGLLVFTNPRMEDYEQYLRQEILRETGKGDDVGIALGALVSGVASSLLTGATVRNDYVFWSTYETMLGNKPLRVLGVLRNFVVLQDADLASSRPQPPR